MEQERAIADARSLFTQADMLVDAAHRILDEVVGPLMDVRDIAALQKVANVLPSGFHKSEIQLFINHIKSTEQ